MVRISVGVYYCNYCKAWTYHALINETRTPLFTETLIDNLEPSRYENILTCTECMNPNKNINKN